jgi:hypothetical protein
MHFSELNVERVEGLPDAAYWQMVDASVELRRQEASVAKAYYLGGEQAARDYSDQFNAILGSKNLVKYRAAHQQQRDTMRAARERERPSREGREELDELRRRSAAQSKDVIRQLGLDVARVKQLRNDHRAKLAALFSATIGKGETVGVEEKKVKNATFTPPYNGGSSFISIFIWKSDPTDILPAPSFSTFVNRHTGEIGDSTASSLSDASDFVESERVCRTAMRQWYKMPSEGQVRVSCVLEAINAFCSGSIVNEWGVSDIDLKQAWNTFARVTSPTVSPKVYLDSILNAFENDDTNQDDHTWFKPWMAAGTLYGNPDITTVLPGVFAKGTWVLVDVGVESRSTFTSNDCSVTSHQTTRFLTRKIGLSSTGG